MAQVNESKLPRTVVRKVDGQSNPIRVERVQLGDLIRPQAGLPVRMSPVETDQSLTPAWMEPLEKERAVTDTYETVEGWERRWEREARRYRSWGEE